MNDEEKDNVFKINVPIITNEELERLDYTIEDNLDSIVEKISKTVSKDKDIIILKKVIEKQSKEIERLDKKFKNATPDEIVSELYISKDELKEILGLEEGDDDSTKGILEYIKIIIEENARLEDIEDRKVQIEYNNVFNKGVKSVEDKIKSKVIEVKDRQVKDQFITASQGKLDTIIDMESLLEKEEKK